MEERQNTSLLNYKTMKEKMEALLAAATETSSSNDTNRSSRGKNQQENDEEDARIAGQGDNSRDMKAQERSKKVLTRLRSNSSLFGDEVKEGRRSSMNTAVSCEGE